MFFDCAFQLRTIKLVSFALSQNKKIKHYKNIIKHMILEKMDL